MTTFTVRIQGNRTEFNIFAKAKTAAEAVEKTVAKVMTAAKYAKVRTDADFKVFTV